MCEKCDARIQKFEKPDDRMKVHDADVQAIYRDGLNVDDMMMTAFDKLEQVADDQNARNIFLIIAATCYPGVHPVVLYQRIREEREDAINNIAKAMGK